MPPFLQKIVNSKNLMLIVFFLLAFLERTVFDLGPNIELITMAMILASFYYGAKNAFWLTLAVVALTDRFIGNSSIFIFTWSGFLIPALLASNLIRTLNLKFKLKLIPVVVTGIASNIFFFFWTNFGVWYLDSFNMYPDTLNGLFLSYVNALPFLRLHMTSTLIFVPSGFLVIEVIKLLYKNNSLRIKVSRS